MSAIKSDIEIARAAKMKPIQEILDGINVPDEASVYSPMGRYIAKIKPEYLKTLKDKKDPSKIFNPLIYYGKEKKDISLDNLKKSPITLTTYGQLLTDDCLLMKMRCQNFLLKIILTLE